MVEPRGKQSNSTPPPFNKRGFVGPILIQREPVPPRDFLLVVLGEPHAHDELVVVQIDLVHEILEDLVSNLRVVHVGMQELVEVRLNAVPVLAQRHADVFRPYGIWSALEMKIPSFINGFFSF